MRLVNPERLIQPPQAKQGKRLRYLYQNETRLGLKTETGRVITARGVKPIVSALLLLSLD